ncbi:low affinity immunoglobulin epsilon Fc receptor-like [Pecten maximus]|uniref:low affinity immunoglobulin epsilon Fc receptor-like n=1 Tax=Pecten maximus TaxID=6579 RepID=UPI0014588DE5|nr:low affinity immunoglobulin epsilon Fc receptor-like [Pecten maximus]
MKNCMYLLLVGVILISKCDEVFLDDKVSVEKSEERSLTSEVVGLLNGTYFNLNEKVCQLQRRVDTIERDTDSNIQCECNNTEILEFKQSISNELKDFSKFLSGFENEIRLLKNEQTELREILDGGDIDASTTSSPTTSSTTTTPRVCDDGWIVSPEKCYYVSSSSEKTGWATAVSRCKYKGANLVEIKTDEESRFIMQHLPSRVGNSDIVYTGRERNDANKWVFLSNGENVDTSVRSWAEGEPDNTREQTCGCTRKSDNFMMHDCVCGGFSLFYICEITR